MSENIINITSEAKATDPKKQEPPIEIDPAILFDCINEINIMVDAHVNLLQAMKKLVWKFRRGGLKPEQAAAVAFELHKRASEKARSLVPNGEPDNEEVEEKEKTAEKEEENKNDDISDKIGG